MPPVPFAPIAAARKPQQTKPRAIREHRRDASPESATSTSWLQGDVGKEGRFLAAVGWISHACQCGVEHAVRAALKSESRAHRRSGDLPCRSRLHLAEPGCPTSAVDQEFALAVLDGKWKTVILSYLKERPCRYAELRKLVPSLSDKVLSERLRDLTRSGLVVREPVTGRTHSYLLSEKGRSLSELLRHLYSWGMEHAGSFGVRVGAPLEELDAERAVNRRIRMAQRRDCRREVSVNLGQSRRR